jgi:hypothetical protein
MREESVEPTAVVENVSSSVPGASVGVFAPWAFDVSRNHCIVSVEPGVDSHVPLPE